MTQEERREYLIRYLLKEEIRFGRPLCCLSTGVFRFPQQRAAQIATGTVKQFLAEDSRINKVIFNVFKDEDLEIYRGLL